MKHHLGCFENELIIRALPRYHKALPCGILNHKYRMLLRKIYIDAREQSSE